MAYNAVKTIHNGSKKGNGAYYGRKKSAKKESARTQRQNTRREVATSEDLRPQGV